MKKNSSISIDESTRRKAAVDYARGSVRLEGLIISDAAEKLNQRYINGELTSSDLTNALHALYPS